MSEMLIKRMNKTEQNCKPSIGPFGISTYRRFFIGVKQCQNLKTSQDKGSDI